MLWQNKNNNQCRCFFNSLCSFLLIVATELVHASSHDQENELQLHSLFLPVKANNTKLLRHIIFDELAKSGLSFNINIKDEKGRTMLHQAAKRGYVDMVKLLLSQKKIAVNELDQDDQTPLHLAAAGGHIEISKQLLAAGGDLNGQNNQGLTPLHLAAQAGRIEIVRLLLTYPTINIYTRDHNGQTPLHLATSWYNAHDATIILCLLEHEQGTKDIDIQDHEGVTALCGGVREKSVDVVEALLKHKANPNLPTKDGRTPLHIVAFFGHTAIMQKLLECLDIQVNAQDKDGKTALHTVLENNHPNIELVKMLIQHPNININIQDTQGSTPLDIAKASGQSSIEMAMIIKLLEKAKKAKG